MIRSVKQTINISKETFLCQSVRFAISGGLATLSHWLIMALMIYAGTTPAKATAVGAFIGATLNYILQHKVTFQSNVAHRSALLRYIVVCTLTWTANLFYFFILHHIIMLTAMYAQSITTFLVALMSYFLYKRIVFNGHQPQAVY